MKLGLIDILKIGGFDPTLVTKLVRYQDRRYSMQSCVGTVCLEI